MATISAIVPAAGQGARAGLNANKVFAALAGRPLLAWTLQKLSVAPYETAQCRLQELIVAAQADEFEEVRRLAAAVSPPLTVRLVEGGTTRQDSVFNAVRVARGDFVLVHDAARPCFSPDIVVRTLQAALESGAAIAALPASDTVKRTAARDSAVIAETLDRATIWLAQTPQVFRKTLLLEALEAAQRENFPATDCASLVERAGHAVALVEGSAQNLKVTYPADFERAAALLKAEKNPVSTL